MRKLAATVLLLVFAGCASAQAACLQANQVGQVAEGRLTAGKFRDAAGRPETAFILRLSAATCLAGPDADDNVRDVARIHVFSMQSAVRRKLSSLVGRVVQVRGNPFPAMTAHHHAPIVMDVSDVAAR
ncbi:MAG: DUF4431 domain-containing protein [Variibacter sp.]|nr:DUF4431 domain-containing protein [Variibacter sp.]